MQHAAKRTVRLRVLNVVVDVRGSDALLTTVEDLWAAFLTSDEATATVEYDVEQVVRRDQQTIATALTPEHALSILAADMNQQVLSLSSDVACHAGVVAWDDRVVAWPATSGAGKSTLVAASCARAQARYLSDEALVLVDEGERVQVLAYPRPVGLSALSARLAGLEDKALLGSQECFVSPRWLQAVPPDEVLSLTDLIDLDRRETGRAQLTALPRAEAIPLLLRRSFNAWRTPDRAYALAVRTAQSTEFWRLTYSDATEAAELLKSTFAASA